MALDDASREAPAATTGAPARTVGRIRAGLRPYLRPSRFRMVLFGATSLLSGLGEAFLLYLVVRLATAIAAGEEQIPVSVGPVTADDLGVAAVFWVALGVLALLVALAVANATLAARMSMVALTTARHRTFGAFVDASWDLQSRERRGGLQELLTTHVKKVAQCVRVVTDGVTAAVSFLAFIVAAVLISPVAAGTILVGVVVLYLLLRPVTRLTRTTSRRHVAGNTGYALSVSEAVAMAREIRAFNVGDVVRAEVAAEAEQVARSGFTTWLLAKLTPNLYLQAALLLLIVGMAGVYASDVGEVAQLGAVVLLLVRALTYSQQLQTAIQQTSELAAYLERLTEQEALYHEHAVRGGSEPLGPVRSLAFERVGFAYEPGQPVLRDVTFALRGGETIGVIGPSGSGKSTLVQLLLGLRSPTEGRYLVDGRPASAYAQDAWFEQFTLVPQDNQLLRASVADNIRFYRRYLTDDEVAHAARLAHLHDEIATLPDGYGTEVGAGAMDLSGGQRQRLGLARALAGRPSVLVLDEPTSALDMRSEALIQETLEELRGRLTMVIVAHRMTTLRRCDRIMVLRDGRLEAFGTPDELLATNGFYREASRLSTIG